MRPASLAYSLIKRIHTAAFKIADSSLEAKLRRKLNSHELAGAYIVRSIDVLLQTGTPPDKLFERHMGLVESLHHVRRRDVERVDAIIREEDAKGAK